MKPIDQLSTLVSDELTRRRSIVRPAQKGGWLSRAQRSLDNLDFTFDAKMNRSLIFDLATARFVDKREDVLFLGPGDPETFCTSLLHR